MSIINGMGEELDEELKKINNAVFHFF
jgi:hypothetical protein